MLQCLCNKHLIPLSQWALFSCTSSIGQVSFWFILYWIKGSKHTSFTCWAISEAGFLIYFGFFFVKLNIRLQSRLLFNYSNSVNKAFLAEGSLVLSFLLACTPCNKNPNTVCQVIPATFMVLLTPRYIAARGISPILLSSTVRLGPTALDSSLIYSEMGEGWCCSWDSALSHQWKWEEACKIEFTVLRMTLGHKRLCTQVTFPAQSHLVLVC